LYNEQESLWEYLAVTEKPIVMYGTGDGADKILDIARERGIEISAFAVSDEFARGQTFQGYKTERFGEIKERLSDFIILVCFGTDKPDVLGRIYALSEDYQVFAPDVPVAGGGLYDSAYVAENTEKIDKARKLLSDEKSVETFDGWLNYRLSGDINILKEIAVDRDEVTWLLGLKPDGGECFVDVGAYKGDTVDEFLTLTAKNFKKIIAIEPDARNHLALRRRFYAYGSAFLTAINAAASDNDGEEQFFVKTGRGGTGGFTKRGRLVKIPAVKLDTVCQNDKPTYIKIDAEGAEARVIKGAAGTIKKHRPKMIVAAYHRAEDMFALPIMLNALNPRYKMFLRKTRCLPGWEFNLILV